MGSYYHKLFLRDDPQLCLRMSSHSNNKFQEPGSILPNPMVAGGMPFMPFGIMPAMLPPNMTQVDVSQQSQLINQQLQQLQWQQYQLQQYQQQQQAAEHNHANGPPPADGSAPAPTTLVAAAPGSAPVLVPPIWGVPPGIPPGVPPPGFPALSQPPPQATGSSDGGLADESAPPSAQPTLPALPPPQLDQDQDKV